MASNTPKPVPMDSDEAVIWLTQAMIDDAKVEQEAAKDGVPRYVLTLTRDDGAVLRVMALDATAGSFPYVGFDFEAQGVTL